MNNRNQRNNRRNGRPRIEAKAVSDSRPLEAADLLHSLCPLHHAFRSWCIGKGVELTKRQARKYLQGPGKNFRAISVPLSWEVAAAA